jgi:hypothetical protein
VLDREKGGGPGERSDAGVLQENTVGRGDRDACWWQDGVVLDWEKAVEWAGVLQENTVGRGDRDACWWQDGVVLDWEKAAE